MCIDVVHLARVQARLPTTEKEKEHILVNDLMFVTLSGYLD